MVVLPGFDTFHFKLFISSHVNYVSTNLQHLLKMAQKILQTCLSAGMSAVSGFHSENPHRVDASYDGLKHVLSVDIVPKMATQYTLKGKGGKDVQIPPISWGAWSWGDHDTFHWSDDELPALQAAWKKCLENGQTLSKQRKSTEVAGAKRFWGTSSTTTAQELIGRKSSSKPSGFRWLPTVGRT